MNENNYAMSFAEIAERTGSTEVRVYSLYKSAMNKIKRNPQAIYDLKRMCALVRRGR